MGVPSSEAPPHAAAPPTWTDEGAAVEFAERLRWNGAPRCPRCASEKVSMLKDRATGQRNRRFLWRCRTCERQFTVRIGTLLNDSPLPMTVWCRAFDEVIAERSISAAELCRRLGISYKSTLLVLRRVRRELQPGGLWHTYAASRPSADGADLAHHSPGADAGVPY